MIGVLAWCSVLFAVGGTKGKYWRRFVLPSGLLVIAILSHVIWWKSVLMTISLIVALSLGYGERTPYKWKAAVFSTYGLSFLWIGWSWWIVLCPVLCFLLFCLSNWKPTESMFSWKWIEFVYGLFLAVTFISILK
jgi:hypothetical protein